jgi:hypothetical protein
LDASTEQQKIEAGKIFENDAVLATVEVVSWYLCDNDIDSSVLFVSKLKECVELYLKTVEEVN